MRPLFYFDGIYDGGGYYTRSLAAALGPDQPFYSVRPFPLVGGKLPTVEDMAKQYAALIKSTTPGPYRIAGYCNAGVIAVGVARALEDMGEDVERLVIVDPLSLTRGEIFACVPALRTLSHDQRQGRYEAAYRQHDQVWDEVLKRDEEAYPSEDGRVGLREGASVRTDVAVGCRVSGNEEATHPCSRRLRPETCARADRLFCCGGECREHSS